MKDIKELGLKGLEGFFTEWGEHPFHARQVLSWIYKKGALDFEVMSDLSAPLRKKLKENFYIVNSELIKKAESSDGTKKLLLELKDGNFIEAVIIPAQGRVTGCVSTQVGCKFACSFCASGALGFKRNLSSAEIIEEVLYLKDNSQDKKLTHIVFMGIGEPLDNYDNLIGAIRSINSSATFNIGARRITISTSGLVPAFKKLAKEGLQVELSVSLHAADDKTRSMLMPINKIYPLKDLINACREYINKTNRQITFEYILIKDVNSGLQNALKLSRILKGLTCKMNLIPSNPVRELGIYPPARREVLLFRDCLENSGIRATLRKPRGEDIEAACGQLRLKYENK